MKVHPEVDNIPLLTALGALDKFIEERNKCAEFLEELKKELKERKKWLWSGVPYDDMWTGGRESELGDIIEKIEKFQAEQNQVSDEQRD